MATAPISGRDTVEKQGYIAKPMPDGGGLFAGTDPELYKKARHLMTDFREITFHDARTTNGGLENWRFDTHGLCVLKTPAAAKEIDLAKDPGFDHYNMGKKPTNSKVREVYYKELCELAKKVTGAPECYVESHMLREPKPKFFFSNPSRFAHSDASARSPMIFRKTLVKKFGFSEDRANAVDICSCNIWHPIEYPAYRDPLCLLDASTVNMERDMAPIPYVTPEGKSVYSNSKDVKNQQFDLEGPCFHPNHRWLYISDQTPDEMWMFKQWDTRDSVAAKQCYHNSFHDPFYDNDDSKPGRKSMEFRLLLVFPKELGSAKL